MKNFYIILLAAFLSLSLLTSCGSDKGAESIKTAFNINGQEVKPATGTLTQAPDPSQTEFYLETPLYAVVSFDDLSGPAPKITSRVWDFGDGNPLEVNDTHIEHAYTASGFFKVTLCINGDLCLEKYVMVQEPSAPDTVAEVVETPPAEPVQEVAPVERKKRSEPAVVDESTSEQRAADRQARAERAEQARIEKAEKAERARIAAEEKRQQAIARNEAIKMEQAAKMEAARVEKERKAKEAADKAAVAKNTPPPAPTPQVTTNVDCSAKKFQQTGKLAALPSNARDAASSSCRSWVSGPLNLTITPADCISLDRAYVYVNQCGVIKVTLSGPNGTSTDRMAAAEGRVEVDFSDMNAKLEKGKTYNLTISTEEGGNCSADGAPKIEKITCDNSSRNTPQISVAQGKGGFLYELKYKY